MILSTERMYNVHIILVCECSWFIPPLWSSDDRALSLFLFCQGMAWVLISYSPLSRIVFNSTTARFTSIYLTILYIIYKISSKNYLYIIKILFITINSLVLYSTLLQPTSLYIDPHRPVLSHALPREWVRGDLANGGWMLTFHNQAWKWEDTRSLYYSFILLPTINCIVMLNIHTISSMPVESGGYINNVIHHRYIKEGWVGQLVSPLLPAVEPITNQYIKVYQYISM